LEYVDKLKEAQLIPGDIQYETIRSEVEKTLEDRLEVDGRLSDADREIFLRSGIYREILTQVDQTDPSVGMKLGVLERYAYKQGSLKAKAGLAASYQKSYHHSLGINRYAWFTSPIRRYADMVNHRQLKAVLSGKALESSGVDVNALSREFNQGRNAARELDKRLLYYHLCCEQGLREQETLTVVVSSFQWVMWHEWAIEIQGIWQNRYPLNFVVENVKRSSRISDNGLQCRLNNGPAIDVGDTITITMGQENKSIDPANGTICIKIQQIAKG